MALFARFYPSTLHTRGKAIKNVSLVSLTCVPSAAVSTTGPLQDHRAWPINPKEHSARAPITHVLPKVSRKYRSEDCVMGPRKSPRLASSSMRKDVRARVDVDQCIISSTHLYVLSRLSTCDMRPCGTASVLPGATLQGMIHEQHQPSRRVPNKRALIMPLSWTPSKL